MSTVAHRYALAAWRLAQDGESQETLLHELRSFVQAMQDQPLLQQTLTSPSFARENVTIVAQVAQAADLMPLSRRVLSFVQQQGRISLLADIVDALESLVDESRGRLRAYVQVAVPLDDGQVVRLEKTLSKRFGKPVIAQVQIQPALVAGMICRVGKFTFDSSLRKQLGEFAERVGVQSA